MPLSGNNTDILDATLYSDALRVDEADASTTYVGFNRNVNAAETEATWQIKRITVSGNITKIKFAGEGDYAHTWSERTTLNY